MVVTANQDEIEQRFWSKVERTETCWIWTGGKDKDGYGNYGYRINGKVKANRAHRFAYEALVGPIPEGLTLDHTCRVHACVNPSHLEPCTTQENTARATKTHCKHGHEFTESNTYLLPRGQRVCRVCNNERTTRYRRKKKESDL